MMKKIVSKLNFYVYEIIVFSLRIILGWGFLVPLSILIPKDKSVIFLTRFSNNFDGNLKYLFLFLIEKGIQNLDVFFLTSNREVENDLVSNNLPVIYYPKFSTLLKLLRAGVIIVDGHEWRNQFKYYPLFNSTKIQLWHGSGMKTIGLMKQGFKKNNFFKKVNSIIMGKHPFYDLLILNSTTQKNTRAKAFRYREILINGQPRNDIFFKDDIKPYLVGIDEAVYNECVEYKNNGFRIVAYCPTYRDTDETQKGLNNALDIEKLNSFAVEHKIIFIFKYHPKTKKEHTYDLSGTSNIFEYGKNRDAYPLLTKCDLMITDYSSIFVDYILQDKPVVFFPFDYEKYVDGERALQFDYEDVTPGVKCFNYNDLEVELKKSIVDGIDKYKDSRNEVLKKFFDTVDGKSCDRILDYMKKRNREF